LASFESASGTLTLRGGDAYDTLRLTATGGVLTLTPEDALTRIAAPLPALAYAELRAVVVDGPMGLTVAELPALGGLYLRSDGPVTLAAPLTLGGELRVEAARLTVTVPVSAASIDLAAAGVLDLLPRPAWPANGAGTGPHA
jgi:hypothetical protein